MPDMLTRIQKFLNADSVKEGKVLRLTIDDVLLDQELGDKKEKKDVIKFREDDRGLVLRPVLIKQLSTELGSSNSDNWIGRAVELYQVTIEFGGKLVPAIRVRAAKEK